MEKGSVSPVFAGPTCSVRFSKFFVAATGTAVWLAASVWGHAEQRALSLSSFDSPFGSHKLIYAYPAVTVENGNSSVWGENFSAAPNLRSMPTAVSVQSSVWSSSFAPAPEPRVAPAPRREPESATPAEPKPKKHKRPEPAPAEETEKPHPKKHVEAEEEPAQPKFHARPHLREKEEEAKETHKEIVQKEVIPPVEEKPLVQVSGSAGYYSRYMFRGLDVAYRTGIDKNNESAFVGTNAAISVGDFALGAWYIQSLNSYVPGGAGFDKSFGNPAKDTSYRTPPRERYQEYDLFANYTFHLTHDLALTTGMNFYWFSDGRFWAQGDKHVDSTMEAAASLSWTGVPYLNQSLSYYYDFDAFKGAYLEYKVATKPLQIYRNGDFAIGLSPSLSVSYDFRYNGTNNGWNNFEPGIDMPIHISDGLGLNFGVRYSWDLGDHSSGAHGKPEVRTDDRLWFSASFQYNFPVGSRHENTSKDALTDSKNLISAYESEPDNGRWRVSAGAGMRTMHASFDVGRAAPFNIGSLFSKKTGGGDLGFATDRSDARYLDGVVYSGDSSGYGDGTTDFTVQNAAQVKDDGAHGNAANNPNAINRQITYHSERYTYSNSEERSGFKHEDDDQVVYPYLNLSYEIVKNDRFSASVGLGYQYNHSSTQSGTKLVGFQTATENKAAHQFIYNIDELFSTNDQITPPLDSRALFNDPKSTSFYWLIYDGGQYNNSYGSGALAGLPDYTGLSPQHTEVDTKRPLAAVATFRASQLDMDMHAMSLPFDFSCKITDRIHGKLSFGPTFNIFDGTLTTETDYQLLTPGNVKVTKDTTGSAVTYSTPYNSALGLPPINGHRGGVPPTAHSGSSSGTVASSSTAGGKGSVGGVSRNLPGKNLRKDFNRYSGQHFEAGVFGQVTLEVDLDAAKRWFVEMYARYDYVPTFTISDGATSTSIDASSWGAGIGIGLHF